MTELFEELKKYKEKNQLISIKTIDAHTGGEPLRIILTGFEKLKGKTVLERRQDCQENFDNLRKSLMWEPRGHADMYGAIIMPAISPENDFSVLFTHNEGYSTMCGHAIIALSKVFTELKFKESLNNIVEYRIESPAGLIKSFARVNGEKIEDIYFYNVPSYLDKKNCKLEIKGIGKVELDIAFGGAFYAYIDNKYLNLDLVETNGKKIIDTGMLIKNAVMQEIEIKHPEEKDLSFLYGTIITDKAVNPENHSRNVCIFADGELDRSPTGTGVSGRLAIHYDRSEIKLRENITIESILGTKFMCNVQSTTDYFGRNAIIPEVHGDAFITGQHEFLIHPDDFLKDGFLIR